MSDGLPRWNWFVNAFVRTKHLVCLMASCMSFYVRRNSHCLMAENFYTIVGPVSNVHATSILVPPRLHHHPLGWTSVIFDRCAWFKFDTTVIKQTCTESLYYLTYSVTVKDVRILPICVKNWLLGKASITFLRVCRSKIRKILESVHHKL